MGGGRAGSSRGVPARNSQSQVYPENRRIFPWTHDQVNISWIHRTASCNVTGRRSTRPVAAGRSQCLGGEETWRLKLGDDPDILELGLFLTTRTGASPFHRAQFCALSIASTSFAGIQIKPPDSLPDSLTRGQRRRSRSRGYRRRRRPLDCSTWPKLLPHGPRVQRTRRRPPLLWPSTLAPHIAVAPSAPADNVSPMDLGDACGDGSSFGSHGAGGAGVSHGRRRKRR